MRTPLRGYFLVLLATVLLPAPGSAQLLGVSAGTTLAGLEGDDVTRQVEGARRSFNVGAFVSFPLTELLSVEPGVSYVEKGAEHPDTELQTKLNYVQIPLLLSARALETDRFGLEIFAGPTLSFEVQCFREITYRSEGTTDTGDVECEDLEEPFQTKSVELGGTVGGRVLVGFGGRTSLLLQGGYDRGFSSIDDSEADLDLVSAAWFLNAGVAWELGG